MTLQKRSIDTTDPFQHFQDTILPIPLPIIIVGIIKTAIHNHQTLQTPNPLPRLSLLLQLQLSPELLNIGEVAPPAHAGIPFKDIPRRRLFLLLLLLLLTAPFRKGVRGWISGAGLGRGPDLVTEGHFNPSICRIWIWPLPKC
jgi:hypothetical protein